MLSPAGAQPPRRFAWGVCVPAQCGVKDAVSVGNFLLSSTTSAILPAIASIVPQFASLKNLEVTSVGAVCRGADDPAPEVKPWMGVFYAFLALIGVLTITGTALEYYERQTASVAVCAKVEDSTKCEMELKQRGQEGICNGGFQDDGIEDSKSEPSGNSVDCGID